MIAGKDDLTGAALVRLMRLSLAEQGIAAEDAMPALAPNRPHASLSAKAALAEAVLAAHGPVPLLKIGASVPRMAFDPIGAALLAARSGHDLIARWTRLERYVHNRHPIVVRSLAQDTAELAHFGDLRAPPGPAVDYMLAGVIAGLLRATGCREVTLTMGAGAEAFVMLRDGTVTERPGQPSPTGLWRFAWQDGDGRAEPAGLLADEAGRISRAAAAIIETDLPVSLSLADLAARLRQSRRTVQRRLAEDGLSLQALRRTAQVRKASIMLLESQASVAAIGFACGFSDAAHFTRAFGQATGLSPGEYRRTQMPGPAT